MAIEAHVHSIGKVSSELDKQRAEVLVHEIKVVVVTHHAGTTEPGDRFTRVRAEFLGDTEGGEFRLRFANIKHPFGGMKVL